MISNESHGERITHEFTNMCTHNNSTKTTVIMMAVEKALNAMEQAHARSNYNTGRKM